MRRPDANSASVELPDIESQSPEIQDFLRLVRDRFGIDFDSTMGRVISTIPSARPPRRDNLIRRALGWFEAVANCEKPRHDRTFPLTDTEDPAPWMSACCGLWSVP